MAYDLETFLSDLETLLKANLNTRIGTINTEKNDSITLSTVDSSAWFFQSLNGAVVNFNPFILYGVAEFLQDEGLNYGFSSTKVLINVVICVADTGQDVNISKRMLRYQRALKEVCEENFHGIAEQVKLKVQSQVPVDIALLNDSFTHKAIGITIEANIG